MARVTTWIALLRGVNVGGGGKLPMGDLRAALAGLGLEDVVTYIQSGNAVFRSAATDPAELAGGIEERIAAEVGLEVTVVVRSATELARIAGSNPFPGAAGDPAKHHVAFLDRVPEAGAVAALDPDRSPPDEFRVLGAEIYLRYPNGSGRSKLTGAWFERQLGVRATARNWSTVTKLLELAGA
jgi:uncharacterized protein (DUF1697 family)